MMIVLILFLLLISADAMAHEDARLLQEIEQLKVRVERLEQQLGATDVAQPVEEVAQPAAARSGVASARYWLSSDPEFNWKSEPPLREGMTQLGEDIRFSPDVYGYQRSGLFDNHYNASSYPVAAVLIEGELMFHRGGTYTLTVKPTPPREVGGSGNTSVAIEIYVAGKRVLSQPFSTSLAAHQAELNISAGRQPLKIEIIARSPGFGPSPTKTLVKVSLQAEGEIAPRPLSDYLVGNAGRQ